MDKLEFDVRLERLERRVFALSAFQAFLLMAVMAFTTMALIRRSPHEMGPPTVSTSIAIPTAGAIAITLADLDVEVRKIKALQTGGMITNGDFADKKKRILARPVSVRDVMSDMKVAKQLSGEGILTSGEYDQIKNKILETND